MARQASDDGKASVKDYAVLIRPVITEKSSLVGTGGRTFVFRVRRGSAKDEIKGAVERVFGVKVAGVRTCNFIGKLKRTTRTAGRTAGFKKAYVTLKPGHTIDIVEGI
ncbi:MAG: 50S ribosomal protein L23 [Deltaproteobacteria bacterium]|nr:50S ribosomal protein L23 [Deltaproteobacteria bacterium]